MSLKFILWNFQAKKFTCKARVNFGVIASSIFFSSRTDRIVFKHGDVNTIKLNVGRRYRRYYKDIFTTVIDAQWRYSLSIFLFGFLTSWTVFATCWYLMALAHGDISYYEKWMVAEDRDKFERENPTPCVRHLYNFWSAFLFSIETQYTIGNLNES